MTPEERLAALGRALPVLAPPLGAYVPVVRAGDLVWTSGQLPLVDGQLVASGKVGGQVDVETAAELAALCALNALAALHAELGGLSAVRRIVKVVGFVAGAPGFTGQPAVLNGASDLLAAVFGDAGRHARSAVGVAELPLNAPVEIELVAQCIAGP